MTEIKKGHSRPKHQFFLGNLREIQTDPLGFFSKISNEYGEVVPFKVGLETLYMINHPQHIRHIFQTNRNNYVRGKYYRKLSHILGEGLLTLEGGAWRKMRKVSQPNVRGPNLVRMVDAMVESTEEFVARLKVFSKKRTVFDFTSEASSLTLDIVMRSLFSTKLPKTSFKTVFLSLGRILEEAEHRLWEVVPAPLWLPTKRNQRLKKEIRTLDEIIFNLIDKRINSTKAYDDLLDLIITAEKENWGPSTRQSIRDQVIAIVLAGHETGAIALSWLFYEIARNPEIGRKIRLEAARVFGGKRPAFESFKELTYTTRVFQEILRLYPPAWTMSRVAVEEDRLGDVVIPKGATVMLSPFVIHRHKDFWRDPEKFDPDRFLPENCAKRYPFSYFPFGGGPHVCLGNRFASIEGVLTLATLCLNFDFVLSTKLELEPSPKTTLRPNQPVMARLKFAEEVTKLAA